MYLLLTTLFVFTVGFLVTVRNWRHSRDFRAEGLAFMALSSLGFLLSVHLA